MKDMQRQKDEGREREHGHSCPSFNPARAKPACVNLQPSTFNLHPSNSDLREFGKTLVIGMPIVAAVLCIMGWWKTGHWHAWPLVVGAIGMALGALCWISPVAAKPVYLVWMGVSTVMGWIVNRVLLVTVFFGIITPISIVLRLLNRDPLRREMDRNARSYWQDAEKPVDARSYFRQF